MEIIKDNPKDGRAEGIWGNRIPNWSGTILRPDKGRNRKYSLGWWKDRNSKYQRS